MMWGAALIFFFYVVAQVSSHEIKVECDVFRGVPPLADSSPSKLANLTVAAVKVNGTNMLNISWAVSMDGSIYKLTGTRIVIQGLSPHHCQYKPVLAEANSSTSLIWFHHLVQVRHGYHFVQVSNLPLPLEGRTITYLDKDVTIPRPRPVPPVLPQPTTAPTVKLFKSEMVKVDDHDKFNFTTVALGIFGGLAGLMFLTYCYIIYKRCGANFATSMGFKKLPTSLTAAVPVLMVYPAENSAFQRAVVALAEFLQWHGGCSVAVDMWQQGKIAELGPMRWLAKQAKAAQKVLIVCPQPSSQPGHSPPNHPEDSIPAAAHDLYPLILNMVASHAKSASDLAKFCVLQLGDLQDKKSGDLAPELRACKTFCLMKDLNKLCRSLHTQNQGDKKMSSQIGAWIAYSEKSTVKLREAVEKLSGLQGSMYSEKEPLKSVVVTV